MAAFPFVPGVPYVEVLAQLAAQGCSIGPAPSRRGKLRKKELQASRAIGERVLRVAFPMMEIGDVMDASAVRRICIALELDPKLFEVE